MPIRRPGILNPETGESGKWSRVQGRHVFVPSGESDPQEIGEKEIERFQHPYPSYKDHKDNEENEEKEKFSQDYLETRNNKFDRAYEGETYIGEPVKDETDMEDKNKVSEVKLLDKISYYVNGERGSGQVIAMTNQFFTVRKTTGGYVDIQIDDIFFVDQIFTNKHWNEMEVDERTDMLQKIRCPLSFVTRNWDEIPDDVKNVLKSNFEHGEYGGITTDIPFDAPDDYEAVHIPDSNYKYEEVKPEEDDYEVPKFHDSPEISTKGDHTGTMIAGVSDSKKEEDEDEKKKEDSAVTTDTGGAYNPLHGGKDQKKKGIPLDTQSTWGLSYGVTEISKA